MNETRDGERHKQVNPMNKFISNAKYMRSTQCEYIFARAFAENSENNYKLQIWMLNVERRTYIIYNQEN